MYNYAMTWQQNRRFAQAVAQLTYCNPFLPERVELERTALGDDFKPHGEVWHARTAMRPSPNVLNIQERLEVKLPQWKAELEARSRLAASDLRLYRDVVLYALYNRYEAELLDLLLYTDSTRNVGLWQRFEDDAMELLPPELQPAEPVPAHLLFAWFFQLRRAFHFIFRSIYGASMPVARLRAQVWESVFTHDMRRFRRGLYSQMSDITTLITGPSGTGKELVARAIGLSCFIPFDPRRRGFSEDFRDSFFALSLAALSPTLIESELFGHRKGAFSGAVHDRKGWLEICPPCGAVFLDEIGEVSLEIQVKLLRVLQTRIFQRLGETRDRRFAGKLIAATNRDPQAEMTSGRMRPDFYYRLCSDLVRTPSLRQQLDDSPQDLTNLVRVVAGEILPGADADDLTAEVLTWIDRRLGPAYPWAGNFRELEQCVRNIMIRGHYEPSAPPASDAADLAAELQELDLDAEGLLRRYATLVYHRTGSYLRAAQKLGLDRRTVKAKIDPDYLAQLREDTLPGVSKRS